MEIHSLESEGTEITVQMTGSGNACFHAHTRPDLPNVAYKMLVVMNKALLGSGVRFGARG